MRRQSKEELAKIYDSDSKESNGETQVATIIQEKTSMAMEYIAVNKSTTLKIILNANPC